MEAKNGCDWGKCTNCLFIESIDGTGFKELVSDNTGLFLYCTFCEKMCCATKIMQKNKILAFLFTFEGSMFVNLRNYSTKSLILFIIYPLYHQSIPVISFNDATLQKKFNPV